jgi:L-ascorbate metabolism protein UlaG (beta-lactamase superfamily)
MRRIVMTSVAILIALSSAAFAEEPIERDTFKTSQGDLTITFIGHATLMFSFGDITLHVDPWSRLADYGKLPKADIVLITHEHLDHFDPEALKKVSTKETTVIMNEGCKKQRAAGIVMKNGDIKAISGITVEAVPAYNIVNKRPDGQPFHPKGAGNGYIITFGDKRVYVAGDTENTPEMKKIPAPDIAFLPMNLPYTMSPEMVADAARALRPKILYPYHFGDTDTAKIVELLKDVPAIEVRLRRMS